MLARRFQSKNDQSNGASIVAAVQSMTSNCVVVEDVPRCIQVVLLSPGSPKSRFDSDQSAALQDDGICSISGVGVAERFHALLPRVHPVPRSPDCLWQVAGGDNITTKKEAWRLLRISWFLSPYLLSQLSQCLNVRTEKGRGRLCRGLVQSGSIFLYAADC